MPSTTTPAEDLRQMLRTADVHAVFPMTAETAAEVLRANEFDVDIETLEGWFRSGQLGQVDVRGSGFAVQDHHILLAAALANTVRRWVPGSARHVMNSTAVELAEFQAQQAGGSIFADADAVSCRDLLGLIQGAADDNLRSLLCTALGTKLKQSGCM